MQMDMAREYVRIIRLDPMPEPNTENQGQIWKNATVSTSVCILSGDFLIHNA
jgi:hypothetical protein